MGLALGKELISKYKDKAISGGGSSFRDFFKGFYIQTAETKKAALLNFSPAYSKMTLPPCKIINVFLRGKVISRVGNNVFLCGKDINFVFSAYLWVKRVMGK